MLDRFDPPALPATSRTAAKAAIAAPQASLIVTPGSLMPPADMLLSMMGPASAPARKKIQSKKIVTSDVMMGRGYSWRKAKRPTAGSLLAAALIVPPRGWSSSISAPPNTADYTKVTTLGGDQDAQDDLPDRAPAGDPGDRSTTNGAQAIHVAKWNMVNLPRNAVSATKAFILKLMGISSPR